MSMDMFYDIIIQNPIASKVIAALISAFILFLIARTRLGTSLILSIFRQRKREKTGLELYLEELEKTTLRIRHPWMKEEQRLDDILVPVTFDLEGKTRQTELESYLKEAFREPAPQALKLGKTAPRALILGKPGSGKTIAMRLIARSINRIRPNLVPALLKFADLRHVKDASGLEAKIVEKLNLLQFGQGGRDATPAAEFTSKHLYAGNILLLIDGYDELDKTARKECAKFLNTFLGTYKQVPAFLSSRTAVYEREPAFDALIGRHEQKEPASALTMAPFTRLAVLRFLSLWKFDGKKSARELFRKLYGGARLEELASNPLMLTIIAFLYSRPKYTLPDNRVEFYEQCTRALLEEWDQAKNTDRANFYESHQKVAILQRIAFEHLGGGGANEDLIHEKVIHRLTRAEMKRMGLREKEYAKLLDEIVQKSGLLQRVPPDEYSFPHRTFLEYFAAHYVFTEKNRDFLLKL